MLSLVGRFSQRRIGVVWGAKGAMAMERSTLRGSPDRIFISVDESTGISTVSFFPVDTGAPYQVEDDKDGQLALKDAKAITAKYPAASTYGPHFHAARPAKARIRKRA